MKKRQTNRFNKKAISIIVSILVILTCVVIVYQKHTGNNVESVSEEVNVAGNVEDTNSDDTNSSQDSKLDNSGYLTLEQDPNADDAMEVFARTEGLLKGTKQYPVRDDGKKVAYLTFDDGPSTTNTPDVLDILKENDVKATFFIMGKQLDSSEEAREILKREAKEGHAIANHTYSHDYNYLYPGRTIDATNFWNDVLKCNDRLQNALGKDFSTRVVRFPGGYWSWNGREAIRAIFDENKYAIMDWNALSKDAEGKKKDAAELVECTKQTVEGLGPNADSVVILMHDTYGKEETVKSLQGIIDYLKSEGFEFRTMK
ncbi:Peptidoglycan/xylan/chitin deacetylase, PgdA/CDA1 family [Clostridium sp. DSM 8431]|uniref:polysaccharide deacetylase family protein n=1 Tax=Clostridium sp. DSM 8431 TaxID=1761781 RepID=UPI0008F08F85|nr:polysaccharide deacetylase family protein [Clostridium sp. DSM 8431]SFU58791.1 Peptidoglycan/xylan/chitin deacetylase, PgdA/CDA1 family [Clostridium sp. DSM 8431]